MACVLHITHCVTVFEQRSHLGPPAEGRPGPSWNKPSIANPQCLACSPNQLAEVAWRVWQCFTLSRTFSDFYRISSLESLSDSRGKRTPGTTDWQPRFQKAEKYGQMSLFSLTVAVSVGVHEPRILTPCKSWNGRVTLLLCAISSASFCALSFN